MDRLNKGRFLSFTFGLIFSVMLLGGITGAVLCAVFWHVPGFVSGLVFTLIGFYSVPLIWVRFGYLTGLKAVLSAVEEQGLFTVKEIAVYTKKPERKVIRGINHLLMREYLRGYRFIADDRLMLISVLNPKEQNDTVICPSCGADNTFKFYEGVCAYCGNKIKKRSD